MRKPENAIGITDHRCIWTGYPTQKSHGPLETDGCKRYIDICGIIISELRFRQRCGTIWTTRWDRRCPRLCPAVSKQLECTGRFSLDYCTNLTARTPIRMQLELITELLGTPSLEDMRHGCEGARAHLLRRPSKLPSLAALYTLSPQATHEAVHLLCQMLVFNPVREALPGPRALVTDRLRGVAVRQSLKLKWRQMCQGLCLVQPLEANGVAPK